MWPTASGRSAPLNAQRRGAVNQLIAILPDLRLSALLPFIIYNNGRFVKKNHSTSTCKSLHDRVDIAAASRKEESKRTGTRTPSQDIPNRIIQPRCKVLPGEAFDEPNSEGGVPLPELVGVEP